MIILLKAVRIERREINFLPCKTMAPLFFSRAIFFSGGSEAEGAKSALNFPCSGWGLASGGASGVEKPPRNPDLISMSCGYGRLGSAVNTAGGGKEQLLVLEQTSLCTVIDYDICLLCIIKTFTEWRRPRLC